MKKKNTKLMIVLLLLGTLSFITGLFTYSTMQDLEPIHYITALAVLAVVIISVIVGIKRLRNEKKGLAVEDELSHRIIEKAAARSFFYSFYVWCMILIFTVDSDISSEISVILGLIASGIIFFGNWLHLKEAGIQSDESY